MGNNQSTATTGRLNKENLHTSKTILPSKNHPTSSRPYLLTASTHYPDEKICPSPDKHKEWSETARLACSSRTKPESVSISASLPSASHDGLETAIKLLHLKAAINMLRDLRKNASPRELAALREALDLSEDAECAMPEDGKASSTPANESLRSSRQKQCSRAHLAPLAVQKPFSDRFISEGSIAVPSQTLRSEKVSSKKKYQSLRTSPPDALSMKYHEFIRTHTSPEIQSSQQSDILHPACLPVVPKISITHASEPHQTPETQGHTKSAKSSDASHFGLQDGRKALAGRNVGTHSKEDTILGLAVIPTDRCSQEPPMSKKTLTAPELVQGTSFSTPPWTTDSGYSSDASLDLRPLDCERSEDIPLSAPREHSAWPPRSDSLTSKRTDINQEGKVLCEHRQYLRSSSAQQAPVHSHSRPVRKRLHHRRQSRILDGSHPRAYRKSIDIFFQTTSTGSDVRDLAELEACGPPPLPTRSQRRSIHPDCNKRKAPNAEPLYPRARLIAQLEAGLPPVPPLRSSRRSQHLLLKNQASTSAGGVPHGGQLAEPEGDPTTNPRHRRRRSVPPNHRRSSAETLEVKRRSESVSLNVTFLSTTASSKGIAFCDMASTSPITLPATCSWYAHRASDAPVRSKVCADGLPSESPQKLKVCKSLSNLSMNYSESKDSRRSLRIYTHDSPPPVPSIDIQAQYTQHMPQTNSKDASQQSPEPRVIAPLSAPTTPRLLERAVATRPKPPTPPIRKGSQVLDLVAKFEQQNPEVQHNYRGLNSVNSTRRVRGMTSMPSMRQMT